MPRHSFIENHAISQQFGEQSPLCVAYFASVSFDELGEGSAMSQSERAPSAGRDQRYVLTRGVVERPVAERPTKDSFDAIAEWLVGAAREISSGLHVFDEFAWRMLATGLPLLRVTLHNGTLHPQFLGTTFIWWRTSGHSEQTLIAHEIADLIHYEDNPVQRVCTGGETLRRRLDVPDATLDFAVLRELKAQHAATDYLALPIRSIHGRNHYYMVTYVTDRPGGFTVDEVADMTRVSQRLAVVCDIQGLRWIATNVLNAYLGPKTGPRVLAGQIRRGSGEERTVVLWSSDLRGFTERSDRLPGDRMIAILNALFDAQAKAIHDHGGEILKFIGDGLLAMFPIENDTAAGRAAADALEAAQEALAAVRRLNGEPSMADEPPLEIVVALHVGTVVYGNIGAAERLDFTVIGPAVNLVSRLETKAKTLNTAIVVSDDFACAYGRPLISLGHHPLRGLAKRRELFAPPRSTQTV
jgi:adenylate cyclase